MINSTKSKLQLVGSAVSQRVSKNLLKFSKEKFTVLQGSWNNPMQQAGHLHKKQLCEKDFEILIIV